MVAYRHTLERRPLSSAARLNRSRQAIDASGFHAHETDRPRFDPDERGRGAKSLWRQISLILSIAATSLAAVQLPRQARFTAEESQAFAAAALRESRPVSPADRPWQLSPAKIAQHTGGIQAWEAPPPKASPLQQSARLRLARHK